jgi:hypothetical protein
MSPEQCKGTRVDLRSDLYSVGCVMFECLTGAPPFQGATPIETLFMHCNESPPSLKVEGREPGALREANSILAKLLAKNPEQRYPSAVSLRKELEAVKTDDLSGVSAARVRESRGKDALAVRTLVFAAAFAAAIVGVTAIFHVAPFDSSRLNERVSQSQKISASSANTRLEELYKLANSDDVSNTDAYTKNGKYLQEAIRLSNDTFGKMSAQAAESYNRLGRHLEFGAFDEASDKTKVEAFDRAIEIAEYLKAHPGQRGDISLPDLNKRLQRYLFDRASSVAQTPVREKAELYSKAFALGPLPAPNISLGESYLWWNAYSLYLLDVGKVVESARIQVQMHTASKIPLPSVLELINQPKESAIGSFYFKDKNFDKVVGEFRLNLRANGDNLAGRYSYLPVKGSDRKAVGQLNSVTPDFTGTFKQGCLRTQIRFKGGYVGEYAIVRVGPYLSISLTRHWGSGEKGEHRHPYYFPAHAILSEQKPGE